MSAVEAIIITIAGEIDTKDDEERRNKSVMEVAEVDAVIPERSGGAEAKKERREE